MAKVKTSGTNNKVSFGKKRIGKAKKRVNKHVSVGKKYRGQGR